MEELLNEMQDEMMLREVEEDRKQLEEEKEEERKRLEEEIYTAKLEKNFDSCKKQLEKEMDNTEIEEAFDYIRNRSEKEQNNLEKEQNNLEKKRQSEYEIGHEVGYRSLSYDIYDEKYATTLKETFDFCETTVKEKFNEFTGNLLNEKAINRYGLLRAIDDYKKTPNGREFKLSMRFQDDAFNIRPEQACIIC
jgi:hypothetical protein